MQPISNETISEKLKAVFPDGIVEVSGDGYKYQVAIVSETFSGLTKVKRHQKVYAILNEAIASGALHALTLTTLTPEEYKAT